MRSAVDISLYVINYMHSIGKSVTSLTMSPILYFIQANFLLKFKEPAFNEPIIATSYGVVINCIWEKYKIWGISDIPYLPYKGCSPALEDKEEDAIREILDQTLTFGSYSQIQETIRNQAPWNNGFFKNHNHIISNKDIYNYFIKDNPDTKFERKIKEDLPQQEDSISNSDFGLILSFLGGSLFGLLLSLIWGWFFN